MNLKEIVTGTAIAISASLGLASDAEAQFPSTCAPSTCAPKVTTVWEERIRTVPRVVWEDKEVRYQVPIVVMQERVGTVKVPKKVCEQIREYIPHQVCVEPQPYEPACAPVACAPSTCAPKCNDWYPGKHLEEFKHEVHGKILDWRIQNNEKRLDKLYDKRDRMNEHSNPHRTSPGYGYGTLPGFNSVIQGPAVYAAPACAPSWNNQGFSSPNYSPTPTPMYQQPTQQAPTYQQAPQNQMPAPPMPMPDSRPQSQTGYSIDKVASNDGWMPAKE